MVTQVAPDTYALDARMMGLPGTMSPYLIEAAEPVVVDPGPAAGLDHVLDGLDEAGVDPAEIAYLLPTHVHLDHAGATGGLAEHCPDATVVVHEVGVDYLTESGKLDRLYESAREAVGDEVAAGYGRPEPVDRDRCRVVSGGETVDCGDRALELVHAPGHAPHQVCALDDRTGALFAGDAAGMSIFGELLPTTPAPDFDLDLSLETLARLRELDAETLCYGHFGARDDTDEALAAYETLLPEWVAAVEDAAARGEDRDEIVANLSNEWSSPTIERDVQGVLHAMRE